jgi:histidinol-phosphate aminotransferase
MARVADVTRFVRPHLRAEVRTFDAGMPPPDVLRLDLNEGPHGPTPRAAEAIAAAIGGLNRYPDASGTALRERLAVRHGVAPEAILLGPGSNAITALLVRICAGPDAPVAYSWPGFPTYGMAAERTGARPHAVPLLADGRDDLEGLLAAARDAAVLFLATPANPTGRRVETGLRKFATEASDHTLVVIDEAYYEYAPPGPSGVDLVREDLPVVVLRTFSKVWGLAGLRIGYAVLPPALAVRARAAQETFEVSTLAQVAALASLDDEEEVGRRVEENAVVRGELERWCARRDVPCYPSSTNFVAVRPPDPASLVDRLAAQGILVRRLTAFGDPTRVRIGVPAPGDLERTLAALDDALEGGEER